MNSSAYRIELLNKNNYDTWKVQAQAVLIRNGLWGYVNGSIPKPKEDAELKIWEVNDLNARSDLILIISPSELKQVKNCATSKELWEILENTYQSRGPARKATLLKRLILMKMKENSDVHDHINKFMDTVDKLNALEIEINSELLSVMMLYSLPSSYDVFRVAIETRDSLPSPEELKVKIIEENQARSANGENHSAVNEGALYSKFHKNSPRNSDKGYTFSKNNASIPRQSEFKFRCYKCNKLGHKAKECRIKNFKPKSDSTFKVEHYEETMFINEKNRTMWCLDSGSTSHMCSQKSQFTELNSKENTKCLKLAAENQTTEIFGKGFVKLNTDYRTINLSDTLYIPSLTSNLLSVSKITDKGFKVLFEKNIASVYDDTGDVILKAKKNNGLYYVVSRNSQEHLETSKNAVESEIQKWHIKLGHMNEYDLKLALRERTLNGLQFNPSENLKECETCIQGKMTRLPFPKTKESTSIEPLEIIHSDVCGPMKIISPGGSRYFVTFTDQNSRYSKVYFLKHKNEVLKYFKEYKSEMENYKGNKIKNFQSDNEISEYCNKDFTEFLKCHGIKRRLSAPYTPQQNGLAERKNRTLFDKARCLMIGSNSPPELWAEAIHTANYLINRSPSKVIQNKTPFEKWVGRVPSVNHLHIFGSKAYVLNKHKKGKFEPRANVGMFVGYSEESKAYRIWMPNQKKVIVTRDVKILNSYFYSESVNRNYEFLEEKEKNVYFHKSENETESEGENNNSILGNKSNKKYSNSDERKEKTNENNEEYLSFEEEETILEDNSNPKNEIEPPLSTYDCDISTDNDLEICDNLSNRPQRTRKLPKWTDDYLLDDFAMLSECEIDEALEGEYCKEWENAILEEIKAHLKNGTWTIVDKEDNMNVVGSKIILKEKFKANGQLERRKARLVARGFSQRPGMDFEQTYAPVAKLSSIRYLLGLAVEENLTLHQLDVSTAFLNGEIEEKIYMQKPQNLEKFLLKIIVTESENTDRNTFLRAKEMLNDLRKNTKSEKVCLLKKAIYGLKQAGRQWFAKLDRKLKELCFKQSHADPCIYVRCSGGEKTIIAVYVDDIIIGCSNHETLNKFKSQLMTDFEIRDLGKLNFCLGIEFKQEKEVIYMSQSKYAENILKKFHMDDCKPVKIPMEPNMKLVKGKESIDVPYQNLIGSLMYLAIATRPDIAHSVSYLSQFNSCFGKEHWQAAKRVLRYIKGTINLTLKFQKTGRELVGMTDADWGSCQIDRKSYTGYCFEFAGSVISWESKKQRSVALSTAEAEYMALTEAAKEAIHLKQLGNDLGSSLTTVTIFSDNQPAKSLTENSIVSSRSKHISIREHFIRDSVLRGDVKVLYKNTEEMVADIFTKPLPGPRFLFLRDHLGLVDMDCKN